MKGTLVGHSSNILFACQIFHEMELHDVEPSVHTFGAMIDGCARAGQLPKAFGAYGIMISKVTLELGKPSSWFDV